MSISSNLPAIFGLATATPSRRLSQQEILTNFIRPHLGESLQVDRIFQKAGVEFRHTVVDGQYYNRPRSTQERNERYLLEALPLGERAIQECLAQAGLAPQDVDDFLVVSCTGIDTPGLDLQLAGRLGLRTNLRRTSILGMGCYAAFPALHRAREVVLAHPDRRVLVLALELCSLHFQMGDASLDNAVSAALFADGAAAVLIGSRPNSIPSSKLPPSLIDNETRCDYSTFDHMTFHLTDQGFKMHLTAYVPELLAANIEEFADHLLARNGLTRSDIRFWGVHPGSSKILDHVETRLNLDPHALDCSRSILRQFGNMSSPTVLFVLDALQQEARPQPNDWGMLMAFGPGLTLEAALIRW